MVVKEFNGLEPFPIVLITWTQKGENSWDIPMKKMEFFGCSLKTLWTNFIRFTFAVFLEMNGKILLQSRDVGTKKIHSEDHKKLI